jgi:hypothetical protein
MCVSAVPYSGSVQVLSVDKEMFIEENCKKTQDFYIQFNTLFNCQFLGILNKRGEIFPQLLCVNIFIYKML